MPVLSMPTWVTPCSASQARSFPSSCVVVPKVRGSFRGLPRRTDKDATHDAGLVHVQAGATFDEGFHRHHPRAGGRRSLRRRRSQTLLLVLAGIGGDKG